MSHKHTSACRWQPELGWACSLSREEQLEAMLTRWRTTLSDHDWEQLHPLALVRLIADTDRLLARQHQEEQA